MAGAMRKMAVYLGLVEDDGYDGRGFDPDDDFEPELTRSPSGTGGGMSPRTSRTVPPAASVPTGRIGTSGAAARSA